MKIKNFEAMNGKQAKTVFRLLKEQWGAEFRRDAAFLQKENDVFLISRDLDRIDLRQLNVNSLGLYFGELRRGTLRLSIEGSQIIGPKAKKNVLEIDQSQSELWMKGEDLESNSYSGTGFAIVRHGSDFLGCGRIKEGRLINFVPKSRRTG